MLLELLDDVAVAPLLCAELAQRSGAEDRPVRE
jgi:hypothetical protein